MNKISFILSSYQDHLDSKAEFSELVANTWGGKGELALFGDLGPTGITKRHAIETLLDYLHEDASNTISFGMPRLIYPCLNVVPIMSQWAMVEKKSRKQPTTLQMM